MLIPFNNGKIYAGIISYTNIPVNAVQKSLTRLELALVLSKCSAVGDISCHLTLGRKICTLENRNSR